MKYKRYLALFMALSTIQNTGVVSASDENTEPCFFEASTSPCATDNISLFEDSLSYSVPVKMVQAANPSMESMGHSGLDGNATVTLKDGKSLVRLNFKVVNFAGLYGHLLNLWSYPVADEMNYSWWNDEKYEVAATPVDYFEDYGLGYYQGNEEKFTFPRSFEIERNAEKEDYFFIRINVDAMAGFDQVARLDFDWEKAEPIENKVEIASAPVINAEKLEFSYSENAAINITCPTEGAEIYYTTDGSDPTTDSNPYEGNISLKAASPFGNEVVIKAIAVKENMVNSAIAEIKIIFNEAKTITLAEDEYISLIGLEGSSVGINKLDYEAVAPYTIGYNNIKVYDLSFNEPLKAVASVKDFDKATVRLFYLKDNALTEQAYTIEENKLISEIENQGIYIIADRKADSNSTEDKFSGKYWVEIALWNMNTDQASMGDLAFENNRRALVNIENDTATVEVATNPVSVSGYTSALEAIESSEVSIDVKNKEAFTTNTRFDGSAHTFDYVAGFSFRLNDITREYIPVKISVPYTPMDGISQNTDGRIDARLKLNWSTMEKASEDSDLTANTSSASGSSSSEITNSEVNFRDDKTGVRVTADSYVFDGNTEISAEQLTEGEDYKKAVELLEGYTDYSIYKINAVAEGNEATPNGQFNIYLPYSDEKAQVLRLDLGSDTTEPGKTELEYKVTDDEYEIKVSSLGIFAIAKPIENKEVAKEEKTQNIVTEKNNYFEDIKNHWAEEYIKYAVDNSLVYGISEDIFAPDRPVTRGEFITILGRLAKGNSTIKNPYTDVQEDDYFFKYVLWARENSIATGTSETTFEPHKIITREEMAVIIYNYAKKNNIQLKAIYKGDYADFEKVSPWAKEGVSALLSHGIIKGKKGGIIYPKGSTTRAEAVTVICKLTAE